MPEAQNQDELMMRRAIELSMKARVLAPPNPWVGCVIINDGEIVGEGYTQPPGQAHAEVIALLQAKEKAKGSTVYVTLEPCSHHGKTPPCSEALIKAQVARVVIALQDPDLNVNGKGVKQLRAAGIEVVTGCCTHDVAKSLVPYLHHRKTGKPYCIVKGAVSIDGRIAASDGTSQWISSPEARRQSHRLRAQSQAIIVGAGTARIDRPRLTVRDVSEFPLSPPLRVILDAKGSVPPEGPLFDTKIAPTLIFTTQECPQHVKDKWKLCGVETVTIAGAKNNVGVDLEAVLDELGSRGVLQASVDGGGTLIGAFLESELFQSFRVDIGTCIIGDQGLPLAKLKNIPTLSRAIKFKLIETEVFGDTVHLSYEPNNIESL